MARSGDRVGDRLSGTEIVFRRTAADTGGALLEMEAHVKPRWWAGPLHIHPAQEERIDVLSGELAAHVGEKPHRRIAGEHLVIAPGTPHTLWNPGASDARLLISFSPALRTEALFETAIGLGRQRATLTPARELLRLLIATRGYRDEVRVAWRPLLRRAARRVVRGTRRPKAPRHT